MGTEVKKIIHQMKKFLLVLGLLGTLVSSCSNNNDVLRSKDLDDHQLKGNVESVKVATYEAINSFGNIVKGKIKSRLYRSVEVTEFNDSGFITSTSSYTKNGELDGKRIYSYKNNQIDNIISYVHRWMKKGVVEGVNYYGTNLFSKESLAEHLASHAGQEISVKSELHREFLNEMQTEQTNSGMTFGVMSL